MKYEALNSSFLKCLFSIEYWKYFFNLTWDLWTGWEGWILKFSCGSAGISEIWELKSCVADSQTQASFFNCLVLSCSLPIKEFDMEKRQRLVATDSQRWGLEMDRLGSMMQDKEIPSEEYKWYVYVTCLQSKLLYFVGYMPVKKVFVLIMKICSSRFNILNLFSV